MARDSAPKKAARRRKRPTLTREQYLESMEARINAKYDEEKRKLSPEDRTWGDPPDEPRLTREEEFVFLYHAGMKPEEFADKAMGRRYKRWLDQLQKLPADH